jgi:hypothetical protein
MHSMSRALSLPRRQLRFEITDEHVVFAAFAIVLAGLAAITPAHNDTWWHLRSGREIWESGSLLLTERFSHTAYGSELHNHWWLSQVAFFAIYTLGGPVALTLGAGAFACAAIYGSWRLIRGSFELRLGLLLFLILATAPEWAIRPQVISLALLMLMAHLITTDRVRWLPAVCVLWANTHALVLFGVVLAAALAFESLVWSRHRARRDVVIFLLCAAAPMISPLGWDYWPRVFDTVAMSRTLELQEYRPATQPRDMVFWMGAVVLAGLSVARWRTRRQIPRGIRVLAVASGVLAVAAATATRNIAFFAVVAAPVVSHLAATYDCRSSRRSRRIHWSGYLAVVVVLLASVGFVTQRWRGNGVLLGWQPISPAAISGVRACPGPLFNHLEDGGYLMWAVPERGVFVDSRMEAYPLELLQRSRTADLHGDYARLFEDFAITCAIVNANSALSQRLRADPSMTVVHTDAGRTVFQRASPVNIAGLPSSRPTGN